MRDIKNLAERQLENGRSAKPLTPVEPGPIPADWRVSEVGAVSMRVTNGFVGTSLTHQQSEPGVLYLQGFNIRPCRIELKQATYVTQSFHKTQAKSQLKEGDVLVVQSGHIGTAALIPPGFPEANCHALIIVDLKRDQVDPDYFVQHLNSGVGQRRMRGLHVGSSMLHINTSELAAYRLPIPKLAEQRKIAEILRAWDEAIAKLEALRAAKSSRASGVAQTLLAPARAIGKHIPKTNWATTLFAEAFEERQDRNGDLGPDDVVTVGKYAIRKQSEHFTRSVASSDLSNYRVISPGDFVYDPMSAYYGAIGRYQGTQDGIVSPAYRVICLRADIAPEFMAALLRSYPIRFQLDRKSSQGNKEGKRRIIQRDEFGSIEFNLPALDTQRHIAAVLADFARDIALITDQLDALRRQKRGLMQKLLTGDWRVGSDQAAVGGAAT